MLSALRFCIPALVLLMFSSTSAILAKGASISGSLHDSNDQAIQDLAVELVPIDFRGKSQSTRTDETGRFRFEAVPAAEYRIRVDTTAGRIHGAEAIARAADLSIVWQIAGPLEEGSDPIWEVPAEGNVQLLLSLIRTGETAAPFEGSLPKLSRAVREGRCADAIPGLRNYLSSFDGNAKANYLLGFCLASSGQLDEALPALEQAHSLAPTMPGVALLAGQALLGAGRGEESVKWLRREAENGSNPALVVEAWSALGFQYRDAGETTAAIDAFERATFLDPERTGAIEELVVLLLASGEIDKAVAALEEGAESTSMSINPLLNAGIDRYNAEDYVTAERLFDDALRLADNDGDRANAHALLGRCQVVGGNTDEGKAHLRTSLALSPSGKFSSVCRELLDAG